jgi:hypothetical protein
MTLTNDQVEDLAEKMDVNLVFCGFKSDLPKKILPNTSYIINLDNEFDLDGQRTEGTHWTCFYVKKYPNGKYESIYFDSYGISPPEIVKKRLKSNFDIKYVPYCKKNIQSLASNMCGWYCLAFLHYIHSSYLRSNILYKDVDDFMELFYDLETTCDYKYNEYVLKMFFQSDDPKLRKKITV